MSASLQSKIESRFPDPDQRQAVLTAFAEAIQKAESTSPGNWIVRQRESDPVLNVRERVVFRIQNGKIRLSLDGQTLQEQGIDDPSEKFERWEAIEGKPYPEFQNPYAVNGYYTLLADDEDWPEIQQLHFAYLERLAEEGQNLREDKQSHDESIIKFLTNEVGAFDVLSHKFSWIGFFKEVGNFLVKYRDQQTELIKILEELGLEKDIQLDSGQLLQQIDPFTFLKIIMRPPNQKREDVLYNHKDKLGLEMPVPTDFSGFSMETFQTNYFSTDQADFKDNIDRLWSLFEATIKKEPLSEEAFNKAIQVKGIGIPKLTQGLSWFNPDEFLPLNKAVKNFLDQRLGIEADHVQFYDDYKALLRSVRENSEQPFYHLVDKASNFKGKKDKQRKFWRLGTSEGEDGTDIWPEMKNNGHASIGWPYLGDLRAYDSNTKEAIYNELLRIQYNNKSTASAKSNEIYKFFSEAKNGDIVIACNGEEVKAIGQLTGSYVYNDAFEFPHVRQTNWFVEEPRVKLKEKVRFTFREVEFGKVPDEIKRMMQEKVAETPANPASPQYAKNQILFGPPGTGKTYQTIRQAVDIIHPGFAEGRSRAEVKTEFERLEQEGRLQFTTFHQSMTYEDFIEGIKPNLSGSEEADVAYKIEDGIFKQMAIDAGFALVKANKPESATQALDFSSAYDRLAQDIEDYLTEGQPYTMATHSGKAAQVDHITSQGNIAFNNPNSDRYYVVSKDRLSRIHQAFEDISAIDNITDAFRNVIGGHHTTFYWAVLNEIRKRYSTNEPEPMNWDSLDYQARKDAVQKLSKGELSTSDAEPYVLIIDEINRGNIAEILGELITLLEPDKRLGEDEELTVRLPYSRESFAVPPNLYVLGTMNTADRSVEALDTALRRRFDFQEITPDPERIREHRNAETIPVADEAISLPELLSTLNQRIEKLLDKDHLIGHSYFFHVAGFEDLKRVFQHNILPLLQEYFYGDFSKIGLVVGEGFVAQNEDPVTFARFPHEDRDEMARQPVIQVRDVEAMDDHAFAEALAQLLNKSGGNGRAE